MGSPFPNALWLGDERLFFYNDHMRLSLGAWNPHAAKSLLKSCDIGDKHPYGFGRRGEEVFAETWQGQTQAIWELARTGGTSWHQCVSPCAAMDPC
jgi:hypothetical protein